MLLTFNLNDKSLQKSDIISDYRDFTRYHTDLALL